MQGLKTFVGVDVQQTRDEDNCRQIFRVLKNGWKRAGGWQGVHTKRAPPKYVADSGLTEVALPDGCQYTLKHCILLVERESSHSSSAAS